MERKNTKFKGIGKAIALSTAVLTVASLTPAVEIVNLAKADEATENYIQIVGGQTSAIKGETYTIPTAKYGGQQATNITVKRSNGITVQTNNDGTNFVAGDAGKYIITYTFSDDVTYDYTVNCVESSATLSIDESLLPSIYDIAYANDKEITNIDIPTITITDEDGNVIDDDITYGINDISTLNNKTGSYVQIVVNGANSSVTNNQDGTFSISTAEVTPGTISITYKYYKDGVFVVSNTKSITVRASYYKTDSSDDASAAGYKLVGELETEWSKSATAGTAVVLPKMIGKTSSTNSPSSEKVNVKCEIYRIQRKVANTYNDTIDDTSGAWVDLTEEEINNLFNQDTFEFTPEYDKNYSYTYSFFYKITDFYGNEYKTEDVGVYVLENVTDDDPPTYFMYDAMDGITRDDDGNLVYTDAESMLRSRSTTSNIMIYAVGADDNAENILDEDNSLTLKRVVSKSYSGSTLFTVSDYADKNLIFKFTNAEEFLGENFAFAYKLENNGLDLTSVTVDDDENEDLAKSVKFIQSVRTHTLIVVDEKNKEDMLEIVNAVLSADNKETQFSQDDLEAFTSWLESNGETYGFAYVSSTSGTFETTGTYYIRCVVADAFNGEVESSSKTMVISSSVDYSTSPTITFSSTLRDSYMKDDEITFNVPTVTGTDSRLDVVTMYRYVDSTGSGIVVDENYSKNFAENIAVNYTASETEKAFLGNGYRNITDSSASTYTIKLSDVPEKAVAIQILVYSIDDEGQIGVYVKQVAVSNSGDSTPLTIYNIDNSSLSEAYNSEDKVELSQITIKDDYVSGITSNIYVKFTSKDGNTSKTYTNMVKGQDNIEIDEIRGTYTVYGLYLNASIAGNYQVVYEFTDAGDNTVVYFSNFTVTGSNSFDGLTLNSTLSSTSIEFGDKVYIPTLDLSYTLADDFVALETVSTNIGKAGGSYFTPTQTGDYEVYYTAKVEMYNTNYVEFDDEQKELIVTTDTGALKANDVLSYDVRTSSYKVNGTTTEASTLAGIYEVAVETTEPITITVTDSTAPTISSKYEEFYGRPTGNTIELENDTSGANFEILNLFADDLSGVDYGTTQYTDLNTNITTQSHASNVTITATYATSASVTRTLYLSNFGGSESIKLSDLTSFNSKLTESASYKITYTFRDLTDNSKTSTYEITFTYGDQQDPTIIIGENFVKTSEKGKSLVLNLNELTAYDNEDKVESEKLDLVYESDSSSDVNLTIKVVNTSNDDEELDVVDYDSSTGILTFDTLTNYGTYEIQITVNDAVGRSTTISKEFTISEETPSNVDVYQVIGTILIVVSCLVLAGVIIYFIVSKVKLDKEIKEEKKIK